MFEYLEKAVHKYRRPLAGCMSAVMMASMCLSNAWAGTFFIPGAGNLGLESPSSDQIEYQTPSSADQFEMNDKEPNDKAPVEDEEFLIFDSLEEQLEWMVEHTPDGGAVNQGDPELEYLIAETGGLTDEATRSNAAKKSGRMAFASQATGSNAGKDRTAILTPGGVADQDKIEIKQMMIARSKDGTAPFNEDDAPGNDSGEANGIIRSYDTVYYTLAYATGLTEDADVSYYTSGKAYVRVVIPDTTMEQATFDLKSMSWLLDGEVRQVGDDVVMTGYRQIVRGSFVSAVPGAGTLSVVLNVRGLVQGNTLTPEFYMSTDERITEDMLPPGVLVKQDSADTLTVSSRLMLNAAILDLAGGQGQYEAVMEDGRSGRGYSWELKVEYRNISIINGTAVDLGSKGCEAVDPICDVDLYLEFSTDDKYYDAAGNNYVTSPNTNGVVLYQIDNRVGSARYYQAGAARGVRFTITPAADAAPVGGSVDLYRGKISGIRYYNGFFNNPIPDGIYMGQQPEKIISTVTAADMGLSAFGISGGVLAPAITDNSNQSKKDDDKCTYTYDLTRGSFSTYNIPKRMIDGRLHELGSGWGASDGRAALGEDDVILNTYHADSNYKRDLWKTIYADNLFTKFDDEAFVIKEAGRHYLMYSELRPGGQIKTYYATKPGGWASEDEMQRTRDTDPSLTWHDSYEELQEYLNAHPNEPCVGVLGELRGEWVCEEEYTLKGRHFLMDLPIEIRESATVGKVYQFVTDDKIWLRPGVMTVNMSVTDGTSLPSPDAVALNGENGLPLYQKAVYDADFTLTNAAFNDWHRGNSILIAAETPEVKKFVAQTNRDGSVKTTFDIGAGQMTVDYKLEPSVTMGYEGLSQKTGVTLTDTLPVGMSFDPDFAPVWGGTYEMEDFDAGMGSVTGGTPLAMASAPGNSGYYINGRIMTIYLPDVEAGQPIEPVYIRTRIDPSVEDQVDLTNEVVVSSDRAVGQSDRSVATISTTRQGDVRMVKTTEDDYIDENGSIHYKIEFSNISASAFPNGKLLDILPYEGDDRGTVMSGSYAVKHVNFTTNVTGLGTVYYSTSEDVRRLTPGSVDFTDTSLWTVAAPPYRGIPENITALGAACHLQKGMNGKLEYTLETSGNQTGNVYGNSASIGADGLPPFDSGVRSMVIGRKLSGTAWFDSNKDGIRQNDEPFLKGITVNLYDDRGNPVYDTDGRIVAAVTTGENGGYLFEKLKAGTYRVEFADGDTPIGALEVTVKNAGGDAAADSDAVEVRSGNVLKKAAIESIKFPEPNKDNLKLEDGKPVLHLPYLDAGFTLDVDLIKDADPAPGTVVNPGDTIVYTVAFANHTAEATTVTLTDRLPDGTGYVEGTAAVVGNERKGKLENGILIWEDVPVAAGETVKVQFTVQVLNTDLEKIENTAKGIDHRYRFLEITSNRVEHLLPPDGGGGGNNQPNGGGGGGSSSGGGGGSSSGGGSASGGGSSSHGPGVTGNSPQGSNVSPVPPVPGNPENSPKVPVPAGTLPKTGVGSQMMMFVLLLVFFLGGGTAALWNLRRKPRNS